MSTIFVCLVPKEAFLCSSKQLAISVEKQNGPPQNMSLWYEDYVMFKKQKTQENFDLPNCLKEYKIEDQVPEVVSL